MKSLLFISHEGSHLKDNISPDTVKHLIFGLKDIIRWFGEI